MPLKKQYKTIPFVGGIDTKTDDKSVQGKLLTCKNMVFDQPGALKKRHAFREQTFTPQDTAFQVQNTLTLNANRENLFATHEMKHYADSAWRYDEYSGPYLTKSVSTNEEEIQERNICPYAPVEVSKKSVGSGYEYKEHSMGASASYFAWAWHSQNAAATPDHEVLLSVMERATGRYVLRNHSITSRTGITTYKPQVHIIGDDIVFVVYADAPNNDIHVVKYVISTGTETSTNVITDLHTDQLFDTCLSEQSSVTTIAIAYKESASGYLKVAQISQAPAVIDSAANTTAARDAISIHERGTNLDIGWAEAFAVNAGTTPRDPLAAPTSTNLRVMAQPITDIAGIANPEDVADTRDRSGSPPTRTDTSVFFFSRYINPETTWCYTISFSPSEVIAEYEIEYESYLTIAPFVQNNKIFFGVNIDQNADTDGSYNILHLSFSEDAELSPYRRDLAVTATLLYGYAKGNVTSILKPVSIANKTWVPLESKTSDVDIYEMLHAELSFAEVTNQTYNFLDANVLLGGKPYIASLNSAVEIGFCTRPIINSVSGVASGGSMSDGTYQVIVVFEYIDELGNIHRSAPSNPESITLSAGGSSQLIRVQPRNLEIGSSEKLKRTSIVGYRTADAGTTYYYAKSKTNLNYAYNLDLTMDDDELQEQVQLYTAGGLILDNISPPMANIGLKTYDRLHLVDSFNPKTIWHSKPIVADVAPEFNDALVTTIAAGGDIVGLADMRSNIIVFKTDSIYTFGGLGPGADGKGSYTVPQLISNRGCASTESIVQTDFGIYYQTDNGIYLIGNDFAVQYVGAQVEDYNSHTVVGAVHMQDQNQVRFMLDDTDNTMLVHDYQMNQWSIFDDSRFAWDVGQTANWDGGLIVCDSLSTCHLEKDGTITDEPFEITTEHVQLAGWEGFQRLNELHVIGTYKNPHRLTLTGYRDYDDSKSEAKSWAVVSDPGTYALRIKPKHQRCRAMKIKLSDEVSDRTSLPFTGWSSAQLTSFAVNGDITVAPYDDNWDLIANTTSGSHYITEPHVAMAADYYTASVIAKKGDQDWMRFRFEGNSVWFDLDNGVIGTTSGSDVDSSSITDLGSGYYWCTITVLSSGGSKFYYIYPAPADNTTNFLGDASTVNLSVSRFYSTKAMFAQAVANSVELNGLRLGIGVHPALVKSRSSST